MPLAAFQSAIQDVLQRAPNPGEAEGYTAQETSGTPAATIFQSIAQSAEAQSTVWPIIGLYTVVYGRVPDKGGLDFWVDVFRPLVATDIPSTEGREGLITVARVFVDPAQTAEFVTRFGANPSADAYVNALYTNVLDRTPDAGGLAFWTGVFNTQLAAFTANRPAGSISALNEARAWLLDAFLRSTEFHGNYDGPTTTFLQSAALDPDPAGLYTGKFTTGAQSQTLTVGTDTFTAATFSGPLGLQGGVNVQTLNGTDVLTGSGATDTLTAQLNSATGVTPTLKNIETVNVSTVTTTSNLDFSNTTGMTALNFTTNTPGADFTALNLTTGVALGVSNIAPNTGATTDVLFQYTPTALAGATDTLKLTLANNGATTASTKSNINAAGAGAGKFETFDVTVTGVNRINSLGSDNAAALGAAITAANGVATYKFSGGGSIQVDSMLFNATTIDGSGLTTGGMNVIADPTKNVDATGGAGADTVNFGTGFTNTDKYNGGGGRDTLIVTTTGPVAGNQITSVEILQVNGGAFAFDNKDVTSIDAIVHNTTGAMTYQNLVGAAAADPTKGVTLQNNGAVNISINGAGALGANNDSLFIGVGSTGPAQGSALQTAAGQQTGTITANDIENITINVRADDALQTASGIAGLSGTKLETLTITGGSPGENFVITGAIGSPTLVKIDASTFTGNLTVTGTTSAQAIIGGSGDDTLTAGGRGGPATNGDIFTGGAGKDKFVFTNADDLATVPNPAVTGPFTAAQLALFDTILDLNLGGVGLAAGVDRVQAPLTNNGSGGVVVINGGSATALTGASFGAAVTALLTAGTGALHVAAVTAGAEAFGLFTFGGETFLIGTDGTNSGFGVADDIIIRVTGVTGTLDASDLIIL